MLNKLYIKAKRQGTNFRVRKTLKVLDNGRSADFIIPNFATGCIVCCNYCVEEGTLIKTTKGLVPVEQIQDEDIVITWDNSSESFLEGQVSNVLCREVDEVVEFEVEKGKIVVSLEHPFYVVDKGWVQAQHITEDDVILYDEISKE